MSLKVHFTRGVLNFDSILARLGESRRIGIATYGLGNDGRYNPILKAIRKLPATADVKIFTAVPGYSAPGARDQMVHGDAGIETLIAMLEPSQFACHVTAYFCFENHAKIIRCDDMAYIGSANLTLGSKYNFEAGCTTKDPVILRQIDQFFRCMQVVSVPYLNVQRSPELQLLLNFCGSISFYLNSLEENVSDWRVDAASGDGNWEFSHEKYRIPTFIVEAFETAAVAAGRLEDAAEDRADLEMQLPELSHEDRFAALEMRDVIWGLADEMRALNNGDILPKSFDAENTGQKLLAELIGLNPNGSTDEVIASGEFQDRMHELEERCTSARIRAATEHYVSLAKALLELRVALSRGLAALGLDPRVRKAPKHRGRK